MYKGVHMSKPQTLNIKESEWFKAPGSQDTNCVEVAMTQGFIAVRDSKNKDKAPLIFNKDEWKAFLGGVDEHVFDLPKNF